LGIYSLIQNRRGNSQSKARDTTGLVQKKRGKKKDYMMEGWRRGEKEVQCMAFKQFPMTQLLTDHTTCF
jgi:hypothetical protein